MNKEQYSNSQETLMSSENVVDLGDRKILVLGLNHGEGPTFPSEIMANRALQQFENNHGQINALALDSQELLTRTNLESGWEFGQWGIKIAKERNIPLIGADPLNHVFYVDLIKIAEINQYSNQKEIAERFSEAHDLFPDESLKIIKDHKKDYEAERFTSTFQDTLLLSSAIVLGLSTIKTRVSRRGFLKLSGGLATFGLMNLGARALEGQTKNVAKLFINNPSLGQDYMTARFNADYDFVREKIYSGEELDPSFYESSEFKRLSAFHADVLKYSLIFRNALTAEVLSAPLTEIPRGDNGILNIPTAWGDGHIILPEQYRMEYLLRNEKGRQETIRTMLEAFTEYATVLGVRYAEPTNVAPGFRIKTVDKHAQERFLDQISKYPKAFWITNEGEVEAIPLKVPGLVKIVDSLR